MGSSTYTPLRLDQRALKLEAFINLVLLLKNKERKLNNNNNELTYHPNMVIKSDGLLQF